MIGRGERFQDNNCLDQLHVSLHMCQYLQLLLLTVSQYVDPALLYAQCSIIIVCTVLFAVPMLLPLKQKLVIKDPYHYHQGKYGSVHIGHAVNLGQNLLHTYKKSFFTNQYLALAKALRLLHKQHLHSLQREYDNARSHLGWLLVRNFIGWLQKQEFRGSPLLQHSCLPKYLSLYFYWYTRPARK